MVHYITININGAYIDAFWEDGQEDLLDYLLDNDIEFESMDFPVNTASELGHVIPILECFENNDEAQRLYEQLYFNNIRIIFLKSDGSRNYMVSFQYPMDMTQQEIDESSEVPELYDLSWYKGGNKIGKELKGLVEKLSPAGV